jgi:hypothetical protein
MPEYRATSLSVIKRAVLGKLYFNGNPCFQLLEDGDQLWIGWLQGDEVRRPLVREVVPIQEVVTVPETDAVDL